MAGSSVFGPRMTLEAAADLSAKQYYLMKISAANKVNIAAAATTPLFALQNKPKSAQGAELPLPGGTAKVILGGTVAAGDKLTSDANGKAITTTTGGDHVAGIAVSAGVLNDIIEMVVTPMTV